MTGSETSVPLEGGGGIRRKLLFTVPAAAFLALAATLASGLGGDPRELPSALIDKPVPEFVLPPVQGRTIGLSAEDLKGEVSMVNVFASWCTACRAEHPLFMRLQQDGTLPIHGLNYKDKPGDAARWLDSLGDPYTRTGADLDGRVGVEWGVYGVPETFVVTAGGRIAYKHIGAVTEAELKGKILPLVRRLREEAIRDGKVPGSASSAAGGPRIR